MNRITRLLTRELDRQAPVGNNELKTGRRTGKIFLDNRLMPFSVFG
jgi:hypothetical protein